jgi:hypothetical protein
MRVGILVVLALITATCEAPPRVSPEVDLPQMRRLLEPPHLTAEEWERNCVGRDGRVLCSIIVQIDCPPDCGIYRLVREDRLARRVWE